MGGAFDAAVRARLWALALLGVTACAGEAVSSGASVGDAAFVGDAASMGDTGTSTPGPGNPAESPPCPCFDPGGTFCESALAARAASEDCAVPDARPDGARLFTCDSSGWSLGDACPHGCDAGETGATAACALPECACFVRAAWCGASAARHGLMGDPPCRVPLTPEHDQDLLGCDGDRWVVLNACTEGCYEAPTGIADACIEERDTPLDPGWAACPHDAVLHWGVHPEASDRLRCAGVTADRITQTIGSAVASAGYHAEDGTVGGEPYTAAIDLTTRGMSESDIRALLERLGRNGFAAWYRQPGSDGWPSGGAAHIHGVFAGVVMKSQLRGQIRDFLVGLNGLVSHTRYTFWTASDEIREIIRLLFSRNYTP